MYNTSSNTLFLGCIYLGCNSLQYCDCLACNVAYLGSFNVESLTGPAALKHAVAKIEPGRKNKEHEPVLVNFKVNKQGITLTDNERK